MSATSASWMHSLSKSVRSVRFLLCPTSPSSAVGRDFFDSTYNVVKHLNPTLPYMVRPWPGDSPSVVIEFDYGEKAQVPLVGLSREALERKMALAVEVGKEMPDAGTANSGRVLPAVIE